MNIKLDDYNYVGTATKHFKRNGHGLNKFSNNDVYLGNWKEDEKEGFGLQVTTKENDKSVDIFIGNWKSGKRMYGLYLWGMKEGQNLDDKNFDFFFGNYSEDKYKNGLYMTSSKDGFSVYIGNFERGKMGEMNKSDQNGFFYSEKENKIFQGKFESDQLREGEIFFINENKGARCKFENENLQESQVLRMEDQKNKTALNNAIITKDSVKEINFKATITDLNKYLSGLETHTPLIKLEEKLEKLVPQAQ